MLIKALILLVGLTTAYSLRCYSCVNEKPCTKTMDCGTLAGQILDRCSTVEQNGVVVKACLPQAACVSPISCCEGDLCNGTVPTGPSVILLLLACFIFTLFH